MKRIILAAALALGLGLGLGFGVSPARATAPAVHPSVTALPAGFTPVSGKPAGWPAQLPAPAAEAHLYLTSMGAAPAARTGDGKAPPVLNSGSTSPVALAAYVTGICSGSDCWRTYPFTGSTPTDSWPRDICCDIGQQYVVYYLGQAPNVACPGFSNIGVYAFEDDNGNGAFISAGYYSGGRYYAGEGTNKYDAWGWQSNGVLDNCQDYEDRGGGPWPLQDPGPYGQLYTQNIESGAAWAGIHV